MISRRPIAGTIGQNGARKALNRTRPAWMGNARSLACATNL